MTEPSRLLRVNLGDQAVGTLSRVGNNTTFDFDEAHLDRTDRPVLGQYFEENPRARWTQGMRLPVWFANLVPEQDGLLRRFLADRFGCSPDNEFELLANLGRDDMPGAVTVTEVEPGDDGRPPRSTTGPLLTGPGPTSQNEDDIGLRFSVAGVQLKLSMVDEGNTVRLRGRGEWANVYAKFPGSTPNVAENEYLMMQLAAACGVDVPSVRLAAADEFAPLPEAFERHRGSLVYVIDRFDRSPDGPIHIEDMNQVVGNWPERKYQGTTFEGLARLMAALCGLADLEEFVRRVVFNIAVGNEDDHLKNWSLIYPDGRVPRLSPAYDIVSTVAIPGLDRGLSLKLSGRRSTDRLTMSRLERLVRSTDLSVSTLHDITTSVFDGIRRHQPELEDMDLVPTAFWQAIDAYRRTVPMLQPLTEPA